MSSPDYRKDPDKVSWDALGIPRVGFFSPNCEPCKERMPQFIEYATGHLLISNSKVARRSVAEYPCGPSASAP